MTPSECSDACLAALQHGLDFALRADAPTDTVDVYETDEAPTATMLHGELVGRKSTLKRPDPMSTEQTIIDRLEAMS